MSDETRDDPEEQGNDQEAVEGLADRLTSHLGVEVESRYLDVGRQLLSDDVPQRLDVPTRVRMRKTLGKDSGDARFHVGEHAQEAAEAMGARAFTLGGTDVYFGRGQFQPGTAEGQALIAHELTHVHEATGQPGFSKESDEGLSGVREGEEQAVASEKRVLEEAVAEAMPAMAPPALKPSDKASLVEKVVRILQRTEKRARQRRGS